MRHPLFDIVVKKYKRAHPLEINIGETVVVTLRIAEGAKERLQDFRGDVIARSGAGLDEMFTVRRLVGEEGVERIFPVHSPKIAAIKSVRTGKVRRAKLYYLRDRVGKARKLKERRLTADQRKAKAERARQRIEAEEEAASRAGGRRSPKSAAKSPEMAAT
ncbi:MAG: 50S ribosomal protein L19 [Phycisphaerales bacterium]|nr:50S ribosomal protein L19 [Phycisphaerales bacterium]